MPASSADEAAEPNGPGASPKDSGGTEDSGYSSAGDDAILADAGLSTSGWSNGTDDSGRASDDSVTAGESQIASPE